MAKFYGHVGYAEFQETAPGVYQEVFTEYPYYGDVVQDIRKLQTNENLNDGVVLQNMLSVVGDAKAFENYMYIRYVRWGGVCWTVNYVEVNRPRLTLRFGGMYNGTKATVADAPGGSPGE